MLRQLPALGLVVRPALLLERRLLGGPLLVLDLLLEGVVMLARVLLPLVQSLLVFPDVVLHLVEVLLVLLLELVLLVLQLLVVVVVLVLVVVVVVVLVLPRVPLLVLARLS